MLLELLSRFRAEMAVDLGTANTLIALPGEGVVLSEPSIVAVDRDTGRILADGRAVGHVARQMLGRAPERIGVVRPLRHGVIADFTLCEAMLRYFLAKALGRRTLVRPKLLVGLPGCVTPVEKRALYNSAQRAGAGQVFVIAEAKAAAIGVGLPIAEPLASTICDIGGGTTEVAVLSMGQIVAASSIRVGGDAMDAAIVDYLRRRYSLHIGTATAERLKLEIGSAWPLERELSAEVSGLDTVSRVPRKASVTSEEIRDALAEPLARIVEAIRQTVDRCGPELASDAVERGLTLAGGGSLLPGLDRFLEDQTALPARVSPDALSAVAEGARICLEHFAQWRPAMESSEDDVA